MGVGIALAGGGIRGIAHVGVLKALNDYGIRIDAIGGQVQEALLRLCMRWDINHIISIFYLKNMHKK